MNVGLIRRNANGIFVAIVKVTMELVTLPKELLTMQ